MLGQSKTRTLFRHLIRSNDAPQFFNNWTHLRRRHQKPAYEGWLIWLLLGGRGAGKTRAGAEWVREQVMHHGKRHIALVAPTYQDAREVMIEGPSGLENIGYPSECPTYTSSRRRLEWPNGAVGLVFSSEDPDGLRGPQFDCAWADEFCVWNYPDYVLSNLRLALRMGHNPQMVVTTTPKPLPALKALMSAKGVLISHGRTADNKDSLAPGFLAAMEDAYGGTRLARQELEGEFIEDLSGALWSRQLIEDCVSVSYPQMDKIIVAIDPPVSTGERADSCGIIVAGRVGQGRSAKAYILHDGTVLGLSPEGWARQAMTLAKGWDADYMLAEVNQGGDMVTTILHAIDPCIPIKKVRASKGKTARAEPVVMHYEQGRVKHTDRFTELEDEMALMGTQAQTGSPDRVDALVWAVTELLLKDRADPRIRQL